MNTTNILDQIPDSKCSLCKSEISTTQIFCPNCGYPQHGTSLQKKQYMGKRKASHKELQTSNNRIYIVTTVLGLMGILNLVVGVVFITNDISGLNTKLGVFSIVYAIGFAVLAYFSLRKTLISIILGFILYLIPQILQIISSPKGIENIGIIQGLIIVAFILGINAAIKKEKIEKDLKDHS